jgi:hypothetical protein
VRKGLSLLELVVCFGLLALVIPFVLNLVPSGTLALRKAEVVQEASAYGLVLIDEARNSPAMGLDLDTTRTVGRTEFRIRREIYQVDDRLRDVVVELTPRRGQTMRLATRMELYAP